MNQKPMEQSEVKVEFSNESPESKDSKNQICGVNKTFFFFSMSINIALIVAVIVISIELWK